jgi:hypothetical protein
MILTNQTVATLKRMASEEGIKSYSKMNKAQLVAVLDEHFRQVAFAEQQNAYASTDIKASSPNQSTEPMTESIPSNATIKMFDIEQYAKFNLYGSLRNTPMTTNQINLAKSLENNFKVSIKIDHKMTRGELSDKLSNVYKAIINGKVGYRTYAEIEARVKGYKPVSDDTPTKLQLETITKLEQQTGVTVKEVIKSKAQASKIISMLLTEKKGQQQEVAVDRFDNPTFRTKFVAMMKRVFNA